MLHKHKRRRLRLLLLPVALLIFVIGWALYWIGGSNPRKKQAKQVKEPVVLVVPVQVEVAKVE